MKHAFSDPVLILIRDHHDDCGNIDLLAVHFLAYLLRRNLYLQKEWFVSGVWIIHQNLKSKKFLCYLNALNAFFKAVEMWLSKWNFINRLSCQQTRFVVVPIKIVLHLLITRYLTCGSVPKCCCFSPKKASIAFAGMVS